MRTIGSGLRAALAVSLLAACKPAGLSAHDRTVVIHDVGALIDTWNAASDAGEFATLKPMYSSSTGFVWVEDGRVAYASAADAAAGLDAATNGGFTTNLVLTNRQITPLAKDAASVSADYTLVFEFAPDTRFETKGVFTAVLVKEEEAWKFLQGHFSTPPLPPPEPVADPAGVVEAILDDLPQPD